MTTVFYLEHSILGDHREQGYGFVMDDKLEGVQKGGTCNLSCLLRRPEWLQM
jgi:hypothetical protein